MYIYIFNSIPLLLQINDLSDYIKQSLVLFYANDAKLYLNQ